MVRSSPHLKYAFQISNYGVNYAYVTLGCIGTYTAYTLSVTQWRYVSIHRHTLIRSLFGLQLSLMPMPILFNIVPRVWPSSFLR